MNTYRIWESRKSGFNWSIQDVKTGEVVKANHVHLEVFCETEERGRKPGASHPTFALLVKGELKVEDMVATFSYGREHSCL